MSITIRFACGHQAELTDHTVGTPQCGCGERRVQHVAARAPRFRGACTGPYAETCNLEPVAVSLTTTPLTLEH